jgi:hypothetical protein
LLTLGEESPARNFERVWERVKIESAFKKKDRLVPYSARIMATAPRHWDDLYC